MQLPHEVHGDPLRARHGPLRLRALPLRRQMHLQRSGRLHLRMYVPTLRKALRIRPLLRSQPLQTRRRVRGGRRPPLVQVPLVLRRVLRVRRQRMRVVAVPERRNLLQRGRLFPLRLPPEHLGAILWQPHLQQFHHFLHLQHHLGGARGYRNRDTCDPFVGDSVRGVQEMLHEAPKEEEKRQ